MLKFNGKVMKFGNVWGCGHKEPPASYLTIDLNNSGEEITTEWQSQTRYPGVWNGFRVFRTNHGYDYRDSRAWGTWYNFIKNLTNVNTSFTLWYQISSYNGGTSTSQTYGKAAYSSDGTVLFNRSGWISAGQDSQQPQYDKSRWYNVTIDPYKGGDLNLSYYCSGMNYVWYQNALLYAIDENLISSVINNWQE